MKEFITIQNKTNFPIEEVGNVTGKIIARFFTCEVNSNLTGATILVKYYFLVPYTGEPIIEEGLGEVNQDVIYFLKNNVVKLNSTDLAAATNILDITTLNTVAHNKVLNYAYGLTLNDWEERISD